MAAAAYIRAVPQGLATLTMWFASSAVATPLLAQVGPYRVPPDTVFLATSNPHRLYWMRAADTLGEMVPTLTVTAQHWTASGAGFVVVSRQMDIDIERNVRQDTVRVDGFGHVTVPSGPAAAHAVDFFLRFPTQATKIQVGSTWADTLSSPIAQLRASARSPEADTTR
jgi:hypothetical protein